MESVYPILETVKIIYVTKPLQKINFQIRHPENVYALIGIAVTSTKKSDPFDVSLRFDPKGTVAGNLSLAIAQKGDVAFGLDVQVDNNDFTDLVDTTINATTVDVSQTKNRNAYLQTNYVIDKAILEGFYEDEYAPSTVGRDGSLLPLLYKVTLYLRYQVFPINENDKL